MQITDLFRQIRNVLDVRVAIDRRSGQPRGFAHADFVDIESATAAKEILENKSVYGRQLRVDFSGQTTQSHKNEEREGRERRDPEDGAQRSNRYDRGERPERRERRDRDSY
jgi:nucleolin